MTGTVDDTFASPTRLRDECHVSAGILSRCVSKVVDHMHLANCVAQRDTVP
jgi:hypothetical protein